MLSHKRSKTKIWASDTGRRTIGNCKASWFCAKFFRELEIIANLVATWFRKNWKFTIDVNVKYKISLQFNFTKLDFSNFSLSVKLTYFTVYGFYTTLNKINIT